MDELTRTAITSVEVAQMVEKEHKELLRDIRRYCGQLGESKIALTDFFKESAYVTAQNKTLPCLLNPIIASSVAELGRVTERVMKCQGSAPYKIAEAFKIQCEQFGIQLADDFVKVPEYEQMNLPL